MTNQDLAQATSTNQSFSRTLPGLQLFIDSTSLGAFKKCPRFYYYSIILGYRARSESVHLTFGLLLHGGAERYQHAKSQGLDHNQALDRALDWVLCQTWDADLGRGWISDHPSKNRLSLVRALVWYLDEVAQGDSLQTVQLASGKPAVELSFSFPVGLEAPSTGEALWLCGHLDRLATLNDQAYVVDIKTTAGALASSFFSGFSPDNQFSLYTLAGKVAFETPVAGIIVDGVQVGASFARFQRGLVERSPSTVDEWLGGLSYWTAQMSHCAEAGEWPMNDKSCGMYGGCEFRGVCSRSPASRQLWLDTDYKRRTWDPLQRRGDI